MKDYRIYKFRKPQEDEIVTEFFLPDKSVIDRLARAKTIAEYQASGYICVGFVAVEKEVYLNERLNETVKDYLSNENYRSEVIKKYQSLGMTSKTFFETMRLIDDFKWTCLSKMEMQVRRLIREDYDVQNEVAIQLYDGMHGRNSLMVEL